MNISSFSYLIMLAVVAVIYWKISYRIQWVWLLIASIFSYFISAGWKTFIYVVINVMTVYITTQIVKHKPRYKKIALFICLFFNILFLAVLKYLQLISTIAYTLFNTEIIIPQFIPSLAISFYLLQLISYMLDAYWGVVAIENNPLKLLIYTIYFPLMVSGPINRYSIFGTSLFSEHRFEYLRVSCGLKRIALGFIKTLVISYGFQIMTDEVFNNYTQYNGIVILAAICIYTLQLYMNFSGCMDIVIGSSQCFGIEVENNFNKPLASRSVQEFWQKWHITLGGFARDYIMNPLLKTNSFIKFNKFCKEKFGKKIGKKITSYIAMLVVWIAIGIWHGGAFKYIIGEGIWFWSVITLENILKPAFCKLLDKCGFNSGGKVITGFQIIRTYILVSIGMLYFRADSFIVGTRMFINMLNFSGGYNDLTKLFKLVYIELGGRNFIAWSICIFILYLRDRIPIQYNRVMNNKMPIVKYIIYWGGVIIILNFMKIFSGGFVYEQF